MYIYLQWTPSRSVPIATIFRRCPRLKYLLAYLPTYLSLLYYPNVLSAVLTLLLFFHYNSTIGVHHLLLPCRYIISYVRLILHELNWINTVRKRISVLGLADDRYTTGRPESPPVRAVVRRWS